MHRNLIDWETLALALKDQAGTGIRLCSLLVAQKRLAFDDASRVLGEHFGSAAVMRRHLERRDRDLAAMLPAELARSRVALPIGRLGDGSLIIGVRDPSPALQATLARAVLEPVVLAVAPARYVERAVADAYPEPSKPARVRPVARPVARSASGAEIAMLDVDLESDEDDDFAIDVDEPPAYDFAIDVDEPPVDDFAIDVDMPAPPKPRAQTSRPLPVDIKPIAAPRAPVPDSLDAALTAFRHIDDSNWLFEVAMKYITAHWTSSLLLALRDTRAVGIHGHGPRLKPATARTFVITIDDVGLVKRARDERRIIDEPPDELGSEHAELVTALDIAGCPIAAPLLTKEVVSHVLVLGEPVGTDREDALVDLGLLVESMTEALSRM